MLKLFLFSLLFLSFLSQGSFAQSNYSYGGPPYLREITVDVGKGIVYNCPLNVQIGGRDGSESGLRIDGDTSVIKAAQQKYYINFGGTAALIIKADKPGCYWGELTLTDPRASKTGMVGIVVHVRSATPSISVVPSQKEIVFHSKAHQKDVAQFYIANLCSSWDSIVLYPTPLTAPFSCNTKPFTLQPGIWDRHYSGSLRTDKFLTVDLAEVDEGIYRDTLHFSYKSLGFDSLITIPISAYVISAGVSESKMTNGSGIIYVHQQNMESHSINLHIRLKESMPLELSVYNPLGILEYQQTIPLRAKEFTVTLPNGVLPSGIHYTRLLSARGDIRTVAAYVK